MTIATRWCPQCGAEYLHDITECADCAVPLVDTPPPPVDHETVIWEFGDWTDEERRVLDVLLEGEEIPHGWEGTDLVAPRAFEARVDEIVEQMDVADSGEVEDVTPPPPPPADQERVIWEFGDWTDEDRLALEVLLGSAEIPHSWEGTDLVASGAFEVEIDETVEQMDVADSGEDVT